MIRSRIVDMIARQRTTEEMITSVTALRDSRTLSHNTEETALMGQATEKLGVEVSAMTRRMENDGSPYEVSGRYYSVLLANNDRNDCLQHGLPCKVLPNGVDAGKSLKRSWKRWKIR